MVSEKLGREKVREIPLFKSMLQRREVEQFKRNLIFPGNNLERLIIKILGIFSKERSESCLLCISKPRGPLTPEKGNS